MAASKAALGYGAKFFTGDDASPIAYTELAELSNINFAGFAVPEVDTTHLQSPDSMQESIPGLLKPGTIELSGNYTNDASQVTFTTLGQARTIFPYKITAPMSDGTSYTVTGRGFATKLQKGPFTANAKVDFSATVQAAGSFTETVA
jgi:hypothetical protein